VTDENPQRLRLDLGVGGATMLGLGSMVGTGVFVSIGIAAGAAGPATILAILLAALVATCNALSSAQLAAAHAVSGGTYEYGYRYLTPSLGFTAGWMFLCAKTASAATAALGFAGYLLRLVGGGEAAMPWVAFGAVVLFTLLVLAGLKRSSTMNIAIVSVTLLALSAFVAFGLPAALRTAGNFSPFFPATDGPALHGFFYATALMFVAYTGYARIATLGEEIKEPRTSIPHAIIVTLAVTAVLYVLVAVTAIGTVGADRFAESVSGRATPLESVARALDVAFLPQLIAVGAMMAMLGVLLNLIIGLSRVVLAMGRQGDAPPLFARLSGDGRAPTGAVILVGLAVGGLALIGSIETAWAFSAFTVLIYYAITNLAALSLPPEDRLYPRWVTIIGLIACLFLAFWVPITIWAVGLGLILIGLVWKNLAPRLWTATNRSTLS
jgi:APA family basic amino acid/polyamine antiporter